MYLTITLRKEVDSIEQGQTLYDLVKTKLWEHPEVSIAGTVSEQLPIAEIPV